MTSLFRLCVVIVIPFVLLPLPLIYATPVGKCAYVLILMSIFWVTETFHLSVTALIPMLLLPLMGVISSERLAMHYFTNTSMLLLGGLIMAQAIEYRNLHKRIALFILPKIGTNPTTIILGFMLPAWFMSMWINNVAATSMAYSISEAVIQELQRNEEITQNQDETWKEIRMLNVERLESTQDEEAPLIDTVNPHNVTSSDTMFDDNYAKGASLCVAYAATCGGISTLTGTTPNLIFYGLITNRYGDSTGINFGSYMGYAMPISFISLLVTWVLICLMFIGPRKIYSSRLGKEKGKQIQRFLRQEYDKLGSLNFAETSCIILLLILVIMWVTRDPGFPLWSSWFEFSQRNGSVTSFATDSQPAILISIILMTWPANNPFRLAYWKSNIKYEPILPWGDMQKRLSWSVVFLLGGSLALADACEVSGLSQIMGEQLTVMKSLPPYLMMFIMIIMISCLTEITSNTATATIVLPLMMSLAECSGLNPLFLCLPGVISTSLAFCLPVSTAPNAIVFANGKLAIIDMLKCGLLLNTTAIFVVFICTITYGTPMFGLDTFPSWANKCVTASFNHSL